jgi:hypothetical protein
MMAMTIFMGSFPALALPRMCGAGGFYTAELVEGASAGIAGEGIIKARAKSPQAW